MQPNITLEEVGGVPTDELLKFVKDNKRELFKTQSWASLLVEAQYREAEAQELVKLLSDIDNARYI